jgi:lipopolysaccharide/colanic/teichoic acid biosynthesis glycosyltransferase
LYLPIKRILDIGLASSLLLLALPLVALIALSLWIDGGRPIFFRQTRTGLDGRPFTILKFRTLRVGSHAVTDPLAAATRVGRFLRRWGLDELPQLWNVLRGDMSMVGPRPTLAAQTNRYGAFERRRLAVRPGLTGWAQVKGRNALTWDDRIRIDVEYVEKASLALDLCILCRTPLALLHPDTAYGPGGRNGDFSAPAGPDVRTA